MTRVLFKSVVATMAVALTGTAARADILIDDFSSPNPSTVFGIGPGPNPLVITTPVATVGNPTRTVTMTVTAPNPVSTGSLNGRIGEGAFNANYAFGASGTIRIAYSYASAVNFVPNMSAGGSMGDLLFVGSGDEGRAANIPLAVTIATATGDLTYTGTLPTNTDLTVIPLNSLSGTGNLAQVNGVTIDITAGDAADLFVDSIGVTTPAVPAPPAAVLALAAVPALGLLRAARRKAA